MNILLSEFYDILFKVSTYAYRCIEFCLIFMSLEPNGSLIIIEKHKLILYFDSLY
jgi:hypothetical protein